MVQVSDMAATIIYPDIVMYTKRIQDELGICKEKYPEYIFREDRQVFPAEHAYMLLP